MGTWLERIHQRHRSRYMVATVAIVAAQALLLGTPAITFFPAHYEGLSVGDYLVAVVVIDALVAGVLFIALFTERRGLGRLLAWSRSGRGELVPAARVWAYTGPTRTARWTILLGTVIVPLSVIPLAVPGGHTSALDWVELSIGAFTAVCGIGVASWFAAEVLMGPVRAELGPPDEAMLPSVSLIGRVVMLIPAVIWAAGFAVGYLTSSRRTAGAGHLLVVYGISLGVTVMCLLLLGPLAAHALLAPIRRLTRATAAAATGRFDERVPVVSTDELGALADSFNRMLADLSRHERELRQSRERIVLAADAERRKVERDIHDGAQQQLVMVGLKLGLAERLIHEDPAAACAMHAELRADLDRALKELRDLAHGIYPAVLLNDGLRGALEDATARAAIGAELVCNGIGRYPAPIEAAVYFCCLEALQNASKHAGPRARAEIDVREEGGGLTFAVSDDGAGFDPEVNTGAGVQNMTDRIGALGGQLRISSQRGRGTTVRGTVPLHR
jgi:signal transduction histidine kinase